MGETREARLKRMTMRSWRRGIKEMDLILGPWAEAHLAALDAATLELYDALLAENDQDIYPWITTATATPTQYVALIDQIRGFARTRIAAL
ncbi:MAG: succinate dehydrogenase assembly factor 2 [Rhodobacteraceae bacterium]|nr:succinate dehydrogenase assembly factor 2 [Paracoccaceae bacterium]